MIVGCAGRAVSVANSAEMVEVRWWVHEQGYIVEGVEQWLESYKNSSSKAECGT